MDLDRTRHNARIGTTALSLAANYGNAAARCRARSPCDRSASMVERLHREPALIHCVLHDADDTVAVVVVEGVQAGRAMTGWVMDDDRTIDLEARQDIPIGHKVALKDMAVGDTVIKYGVDIGKVVAPIKKGEHAHVHNIKTKRW